MSLDKSKEVMNRLIELVYAPVPQFKEIEKALDAIHPATLSLEIEKDVGFAYMMDYYFRVINSLIVKKILQNPLFTESALIELFYCQITSMHKAKLLGNPVPELISSYWKLLSKAQYAILLKNTIRKTWNLEPAKELLGRIDLIHIKMLTGSGGVESKKFLDLFKALGKDIKKVFSEDMNFYDYAFSLAVQESDAEFLAFLEEYTMLFVQLRIASGFADEMAKKVEQNNGTKLDYSEIHQFFSHVPPDSLQVTLEIFLDKSWITAQEKNLILESYLAKKSKS
ncbi:MAG: hypothetical protein JJT78_00220 [Leptospira sp.]|nr:hypothetical protein [Leptospira sp.]